MKFPYGMSDFYEIITEQYFYIDRTEKIALIEKAGRHLLFLRPRRFGKSLWLSILENYYDLAKANVFDELFGHLAIGKKPTAKHNQYFIMKWDFSAVSPQGTTEKIERNLHDHINGCIEQFIARYKGYFASPITIYNHNSLRSLQSVLAVVQQTDHKLYLLIDEYDNIANEVMMSRNIVEDRYQSLLYGEGIIKSIFKAIKSLSTGGGLDKVFITGVSPVMMTDITSGYNIAKNIYLLPDFNDLCGFWESEVKDILKQINLESDVDQEKSAEALGLMKSFYNGYAFAYEQKSLIYNPTLVLYFLDYFQNYCDYPREILDSNLAMDRNKIEYISRLPKGKNLIQDVLNEESPLIIEKLSQRFGLEDMMSDDKDIDFMGSLLYYLGVLTIGGTTKTGKLILKIPNLVIRQLYIEKMREFLIPGFSRDESVQLLESFYSAGDIQPLCDFIEQRFFKVFDNRDYRWTNELTVKTVFLTLLFNDTFYIMDSETSLQRNYADLTMIIRPDMRKYQLLDILIEFKYIGLQTVNMSGEEIRALSPNQLKALSIVKKTIKESKSKLSGYEQTLKTVYGDVLRLRTYSVVAIGFEKLVWEEL